jgi:hypothetical protein
MFFSRRFATLAIATLSLTGLAFTQTGAQASTPAPHPAPAPATAPAGSSALLGSVSSGTVRSAAAVCNFQTNGDYVHVSSSAFEASGHRWWTNIDCSSATTAVVTVQLQEYYSDGSWRNKGTVGKSTVRSGGGAGNRATGRGGCNSSAVTGWRSVIDVDLVGLADDPGKLTTPSQDIACRLN